MIPEIPGLPEWLDLQFREFPRPSFREIEERLRKTPFWEKIRAKGYKTGKSSIYTHWVSWHAEMARKRAVDEFAAAYAENDGGGEALDLEVAITGMANRAISDDLRRDIAENGKLSEDGHKLVELHRKLQVSSARREAERRAAGVAVRKVMSAAYEEISAALKDHPEMRKLVIGALEKAEAAAEKKHAS